ncbi:MAG: N-acetylglucosamine kinase [Bacteroidota bacterium]
MIIVADSGSTKTSWAVLKNAEEPQLYSTEGYNPYYVDADYIQKSIITNFSHQVDASKVAHIYFYGAGCSGGKDQIVKNALTAVFPNANIVIESDLLAAAKSLLGNKEGFISILGTGTNTGFYSNGKIVNQVNSLGFWLGDEGSGAYLGKKLLSQFARKAMPIELMEAFERDYSLTPDRVVPTFYDVELQNRYSAKFTLFLHQHIEHVYIKKLVRSAFVDFFENIVCLYPNYRSYSLNSIGSIGLTFIDQLKEVAYSYGMNVGKINKSPMEGLIAYHRQN